MKVKFRTITTETEVLELSTVQCYICEVSDIDKDSNIGQIVQQFLLETIVQFPLPQRIIEISVNGITKEHKNKEDQIVPMQMNNK